jgi:F0F1-type ATP synthase assembly protein I
MEKNIRCITLLPTHHFYHFKTTLMLSHPLLTRCIILGFMVLVGFSIAKSIQAGSPLGLILALVSLGAGVYFVYLLKQAKEQEEETF